MERKEFLKIASITGAGILLVPGSFNSNLFASGGRVFSLQTMNQIRHGASTDRKNVLNRVSWLNQLQKSRYYKNGFEAGDEDLINVSFSYLNKHFSINFSGQQAWLQAENYTTEISIKSGQQQLYNDLDVSISLLHGNISLANPSSKKEIVMIPVFNSFQIENRIVNDNEYFNHRGYGNKHLKFNSSDAVILIHKLNEYA